MHTEMGVHVTSDAAWGGATKLIYNRVDKAGSSTLTELLRSLAAHNPRIAKPVHATFPDFPSRTHILHSLQRLHTGGVHIQHMHHVDSVGPEFAWINCIREPADRFRSQFYWRADPTSNLAKELARGYQRNEAMPDPASDLYLKPACGCRGLDFGSCIEKAVRSPGCPLSIPSVMQYFCEPDEKPCTLLRALYRLQNRYAAVGLLEELPLSIAVLERTLPRFFENTTRVNISHSNPTFISNPHINATYASMNVVSNQTRQLLARHAANYAEEWTFYQEAKRLLWRKGVTLLPRRALHLYGRL